MHPETATNMKTLEEEMNKLYDILNGVKNPLNHLLNAGFDILRDGILGL